MIQAEIDILENDIIEKYPNVLEILLRDHTTLQNIFWATDNYKELGDAYDFICPILPELITGENGHIIMPRVKKTKILQQSRVKGMAEVYTPSWICNDQNNAVDNSWFGREGVFNERIVREDGLSVTWKTNPDKIEFPEGLTWYDYLIRNVLEITCGEAPYLTSRYDAVTGEFIAVRDRIGLLDRKLRVVNENIDDEQEWLKYAIKAYKTTYGYEWQGDSLLLAREALLFTFIENYVEKFMSEPVLSDIQDIAHIISWNIWQMDGLKMVIPLSCTTEKNVKQDLFGNTTEIVECKGCVARYKNFLPSIFQHNGKYCLIMDWDEINPETGNLGLSIRFVDLHQKN